jgi:hypothetical protein
VILACIRKTRDEEATVKIKTTIPLLILLLVVLAACVARVEAASGTFICTVNQAGPSGTDVKIQLTDNAATPAFTNKWFKVPKGQESRMLAVAMAALINKKKVTAILDPALASPSEISALYLRP